MGEFVLSLTAHLVGGKLEVDYEAEPWDLKQERAALEAVQKRAAVRLGRLTEIEAETS